MQLTVTTFTVLALIPVWFVLWMGVSAGRTAHNTSIGDAAHPLCCFVSAGMATSSNGCPSCSC